MTKSQISNKFQIPMFKNSNSLFGILNFGYWRLFVIWCLLFGASLIFGAWDLGFIFKFLVCVFDV